MGVDHELLRHLGDGATVLPGAYGYIGTFLRGDVNLDRGIDISDPVAELNFLFLGGPPPLRGTGCRLYDGCPRSPHCP